ncbi:uncharacterized protein LOC126569407 [Anopheles aquasalis]|uniref:uncharacterized protein LOC126569407 n=1 Tax=Anopheles aquasalis TaxID=42839 RepID=UPI00215A5871|nr:uncharacterized protein LOC126569407 [Anopheles aquasalis]
MKVSLYIILISILLSKHYALSHMIRKRQLFREQVLPHAGGKIPDSAFLTDRLALNRLQKDGIAVPDGVLLEQRQYQVHPHPQRTARPTYRVVQTPDNRYTSPEGEYSHNALATVDTTYLIPHGGDRLLLHDYYPHQQQHQHHAVRRPVSPPSAAYRVADSLPKVPILKELRLPNYALFNFDYNAHKKKKPPVVPLVGHYPVASKHPEPWSQRLAQDFVSYHAAVGNGLNYQPASTYGSGSNSNGWSGVTGGGWKPSGASAISGSLLQHQPSFGSFEDFYSQLQDGKHRFYRNTPEGTVRKPGNEAAPKPSIKPEPLTHLQQQQQQHRRQRGHH